MKENKPLTLIEILNLEKELELIEKKLRIELNKEGVQAKVFHALGIDRMQISHFAKGRRKWSIKRMIEVAKEIVKNK